MTTYLEKDEPCQDYVDREFGFLVGKVSSIKYHFTSEVYHA